MTACFAQPYPSLKQNPSPLVEALYFLKFAFNNACIYFSHDDAMTQIPVIDLCFLRINRS
jgi:hypothetical protein